VFRWGEHAEPPRRTADSEQRRERDVQDDAHDEKRQRDQPDSVSDADASPDVHVDRPSGLS
jgi:hypothetical protein